MRFLLSYGLALVIIVALGFWLSSGTLIIPGQGPGKGESTVAEAIDGEDGGAVTTAMQSTGLLKAEETHEGPDPALTIAERQAVSTGTNAPAQSVRVATFTMQAMKVEAVEQMGDIRYDTAWTTLGSFSAITTLGVKTLIAAGCKEMLRFNYSISGGSTRLWTGPHHETGRSARRRRNAASR